MKHRIKKLANTHYLSIDDDDGHTLLDLLFDDVQQTSDGSDDLLWLVYQGRIQASVSAPLSYDVRDFLAQQVAATTAHTHKQRQTLRGRLCHTLGHQFPKVDDPRILIFCSRCGQEKPAATRQPAPVAPRWEDVQ